MKQLLPRRIWIIGGTGLLGSPLARRLAADGATVRVDGLNSCDVRDASQIATVMSGFQPQLVVNCAAFTNVDACESQESHAMAVNATGARNVAAAARRALARLIHISTDYVFGDSFASHTQGTARRPYRDSDPPGPPEALCAYGRSKLAGELAVHSEHADALIVRTAWLFGRDGPGFPQAILKQARAGAVLRVVNDQTGSPTYAEDLAGAISRLIELDADKVHRIIHVTNGGMCTWFEFAQALVQMADIGAAVEPITSAQAARAARRPCWSVLDCSLYEQLTGHRMRNWRDGAAAFMRDGVSI